MNRERDMTTTFKAAAKENMTTQMKDTAAMQTNLHRKPVSKIVRFYNTGGPEVLKIEDVPSRPLAQNEVSLRVQAMGLNRAEYLFMHGHYLEPTQLPATLGYEASGVVTAAAAQA